MRTSAAKRSAWLVLGLIVAVVLSGCGQPVPQDSGGTVQSVSGGNVAGSDFVRRVLADGEVTPDEYGEAKERTLACMADAGIDNATYLPLDSSGQETFATIGEEDMTPAQIAADIKCNDSWMGGILELYNRKLVNPYDEDMEVLAVECLIRNGLVPESFTKNDLRELGERGLVTFGPDESYEDAVKNLEPRPGTTVDAAGQLWAVLPSGVVMNELIVQECIANPRGN